MNPGRHADTTSQASRPLIGQIRRWRVAPPTALSILVGRADGRVREHGANGDRESCSHAVDAPSRVARVHGTIPAKLGAEQCAPNGRHQSEYSTPPCWTLAAQEVARNAMPATATGARPHGEKNRQLGKPGTASKMSRAIARRFTPKSYVLERLADAAQAPAT